MSKKPPLEWKKSEPVVLTHGVATTSDPPVWKGSIEWTGVDPLNMVRGAITKNGERYDTTYFTPNAGSTLSASFLVLEQAMRWVETSYQDAPSFSVTTQYRPIAPHAAPAPSRIQYMEAMCLSRASSDSYLQALEVQNERDRALGDFFKAMAELTVKWERNADTIGVGVLTANTHLLFRNELEALVPPILREQFNIGKLLARHDHEEKIRKQEEQARRRREAQEKEKGQIIVVEGEIYIEGEANVEGTEDPWEAEQGRVLGQDQEDQVDPAQQ